MASSDNAEEPLTEADRRAVARELAEMKTDSLEPRWTTRSSFEQTRDMDYPHTVYHRFTYETHTVMSQAKLRVFKGLVRPDTQEEEAIWDFGRYYDRVRDDAGTEIVHSPCGAWAFDPKRGRLYKRLAHARMGGYRDD